MSEPSTANSSTDFTKTRLESGLTVIHEHRANPPIVAVRLFVPAGSSLDPDGQEGLAHLTANVLASRTTDKNIIELNRFKSQYGLKLNSSVYPDFTVYSFTSIEEHRDKLLNLIDEVFSVESLTKRLFRHLKDQQLSSLASRHDKTYSVALDKALEGFYGDHPYSHPPIGRSEAVRELTLEDVKTFYRNFYSLEGTVASSVGAVSKQEFRKGLDPLALPAENQTRPSATFQPPDTNRIVDHRDIDQPTHLVFFAGPRVRADSYVATKVLDAVLGGGMSSRLFSEMREKRSLGYSVSSSYPSRRLTSSFRVSLGGGQPDGNQFREALNTILEQLESEGPSDEELRKAKDYLKGNFLLQHETPGKKAWYRGFYEVLGKGAEYDDEYPELIETITTEDVRAAAGSLLEEPPLFLSIQPEN